MSDCFYSDVTSEVSLISFNVYDRVAEHLFLGTVQIKPVLIHDHTVDQWYKYVVTSHTVFSSVIPPFIYSCHLLTRRLRPFENEVVSGEMRVQITFEQYKVRHSSLTSFIHTHPRSLPPLFA